MLLHPTERAVLCGMHAVRTTRCAPAALPGPDLCSSWPAHLPGAVDAPQDEGIAPVPWPAIAGQRFAPLQCRSSMRSVCTMLHGEWCNAVYKPQEALFSTHAQATGCHESSAG